MRENKKLNKIYSVLIYDRKNQYVKIVKLFGFVKNTQMLKYVKKMLKICVRRFFCYSRAHTHTRTHTRRRDPIILNIPHHIKQGLY